MMRITRECKFTLMVGGTVTTVAFDIDYKSTDPAPDLARCDLEARSLIGEINAAIDAAADAGPVERAAVAAAATVAALRKRYPGFYAEPDALSRLAQIAAAAGEKLAIAGMVGWRGSFVELEEQRPWLLREALTAWHYRDENGFMRCVGQCHHLLDEVLLYKALDRLAEELGAELLGEELTKSYNERVSEWTIRLYAGPGGFVYHVSVIGVDGEEEEAELYKNEAGWTLISVDGDELLRAVAARGSEYYRGFLLPRYEEWRRSLEEAGGCDE